MAETIPVAQFIRAYYLEHGINPPALYPQYESLKAKLGFTMSAESFATQCRKEARKLKKIGIHDEVDKVGSAFKKHLDIPYNDWATMIGSDSDLVGYLKHRFTHIDVESAFNRMLITPYEYPAMPTTTPTDKNLTNVLLVSDIHYGEIVDSAEINDLNAYDTTIAKTRLIKLFSENLRHALETGAGKLHIMLLGDIFSGVIHDELAQNSEKSITEHMVEFDRFFIGLLDGYKNYFPKGKEITCVVGNHGRITEQVVYKMKAYTNWEYLFYSFLKTRLEERGWKVTVSSSPIYYPKIGNLIWRVEHGDQIRGGSSGFTDTPFNPIGKMLYKNSGAVVNFSIVALSHFHKPSLFWTPNNIEVMINGSVIGLNEFSMHCLHSGFPSCQWSLVQGEDSILSRRLIYL